MSNTSPIILIMLVAIKPEKETIFAEFAKKNMPLLKKYEIEPVESISITMKGQLVGLNEIPQPNFISIFKVNSLEQFAQYMGDPHYQEVAQLRADATSSVIGYFSRSLDLPSVTEPSADPSQRLYFFGLANFTAKNSSGLDEFNRRAISAGLFEKHAMHLEYQLEPFKVATVVGDTSAQLPDRIQVFYLATTEDFKNYVSDSDYKTLAPIRDQTLTAYNFFAGKIK